MNKPLNTDSYHRHIIINEIERVVYIEVMLNIAFEPNHREYNAINRGQWHEFIPKDFVTQINKAVSNGFRVEPFLSKGYMNKEHLVLAIIGFEKSSIIKGNA